MSERDNVILFTRGVMDRLRTRCRMPLYSEPTWVSHGNDAILEINGFTARIRSAQLGFHSPVKGWNVYIDECQCGFFETIDMAKDTAEGYLDTMSRGVKK